MSINRHPPVHCWTEVEDSPYTGGPIGLATELRNREKVLGTTIDSRRDLAHPLHRTRVVAGHEPRPVPGPLTERSDLMTQKICFDCFHKLFPDKPIRKVTLGRQCVVCKAQTDRTEQMIPVEAEDIPPVKQIAQVPRRVLHRTERHADRRIAVRVAARGAGQVGRDAGQAGPRDPRHVRAMSADLDKAQAEGVELSHRCDNRRHRQQTVAVS